MWQPTFRNPHNSKCTIDYVSKETFISNSTSVLFATKTQPQVFGNKGKKIHTTAKKESC